jgi:hypothetical protein
VLDERADYTKFLLVSVSCQKAVEIILRLESRVNMLICGKEANSDLRPISVGVQVQEIVKVDCEVRAIEAASSYMHDPRPTG